MSDSNVEVLDLDLEFISLSVYHLSACSQFDAFLLLNIRVVDAVGIGALVVLGLSGDEVSRSNVFLVLLDPILLQLFLKLLFNVLFKENHQRVGLWLGLLYLWWQFGEIRVACGPLLEVFDSILHDKLVSQCSGVLVNDVHEVDNIMLLNGFHERVTLLLRENPIVDLSKLII